MSDIPKQQHDATDFSGINLQADVTDIEPGGSQDQVNIGCDQEGALLVRLGCRAVSFDASG